MRTDLIEKKFKIHVCKDGTITIRQNHEPIFNGVALPFYSTDKIRLAKQLRTLLCKREIVPHPRIENEAWYTIRDFGGELEDIAPLQERFLKMEQTLRKSGAVR